MFNRQRANNGFALLEVMIAVVVMAFGLLALAALQTSLVRASTQSKARSVALSLAKDQIESLRTYQNIAGYQALTDQAAAAVDGDPSTTGVIDPIGGIAYTRGWQTTRYALQIASGAFVGGLSDTGALAAAYEKDNEFKRIVVTVNWTDAAGVAQSVSLEDAIGALNPEDSARLAKLNSGAGPRKPIVLIVDPSTEAGVIPIAVGDGSETAATNPKPIILSRTGDDTVETRFDVLTYAALNDGSQNAIAQSKVETVVIGCTCTNAATSTAGYRPTYWDGKRYAPPEKTTANATARAATGVVQSPYCNTCCRDHHDPVAVAGPKFSPRRSSHAHYELVSNALQLAGANGNYLESCRLIRVDGIFDVAADLSNDYYNLLETNSLLEPATPPSPVDPLSPNPSPSAVLNYQNFALAYLGSRFVPTVAPATGSETSAYNNPSTPNPATNAAANNLDAPTSAVAIDPAAGLKWLHSRGLYIDYLEPPALSAVTEARANCKNTDGTLKTGAGLRDCILKVLPFTSINLTELAAWSTENTAGALDVTQIKVSNDAFDTATAVQTPVRGKVTPGTLPVDTRSGFAKSRASSTNSGLVVFNTVVPGVDPDDVASVKSDRQEFVIGSGTTGVAGGKFKLTFDDVTDTGRQTGYVYALPGELCSSDEFQTVGAFPRQCSTRQSETLPYPITVRFGNYNSGGTDNRANPCKTNGLAGMSYKVVYDVGTITSDSGTAVVSNQTISNPDLVGSIPTGEYTEALVTKIAEGDTITAPLGQPTYLCPSTYTCSGPGDNTVTYSSTFTTCPSNQRPDNPPLD